MNPKAAKLCSSIEKVVNCGRQNIQLKARFSPEERMVFAEVKNFFRIAEDFDLFVLCHFVNIKISGNASTTFRELVREFKINLEGCVGLNATLDLLKKRSFITLIKTRRGPEDSKYTLSGECLDAILTYDRKNLNKQGKVSFSKFLREWESINEFVKFSGPDENMEAFTNLLNTFETLDEIKWLQRQSLSPIEKYMLVAGAQQLIKAGEESFDLVMLLSLSGSLDYDSKYWERKFLTGQCDLIRGEYMSTDPGSYKSRKLRLSEKSLQGLKIELKITKKEYVPELFTMTDPGDINDNYYIHKNPDLELIEKMIAPENFNKVISRVSAVTVLLTGAPGVGKSSFLRHLARKTGRALLSADISSILNLYVGESEKNLKKLFTEAGRAFDQLNIAPICVFDEAESLLYKRNPHAQHSTDNMKNNMISLLLQCLDSFKGILIFCSNFSFESGSFDPAIHRRLHLISEVKSPSGKCMESIMSNFFPELSRHEIVKFLEKYSFITPSMIKNLRGKYDISVLLGETPDPVKSLHKLAEKDLKVYIKNQKTIGFKTKEQCRES